MPHVQQRSLGLDSIRPPPYKQGVPLRVLIPRLIRWYPRQPMAWALQALLLVGFAANIQMTPMRWIRPAAVFGHQLQSWMLPWLLVGITLSWKAIWQLRPVALRLPLRAELAMNVAVLLSVTLTTCLPWFVGAVALVNDHALHHLVGVGLGALVLGLGPAMGVAIGRGKALSMAGGWLAMLACWACWDIPGCTTPPHLLPILMTCAGFTLVGLGWRKRQTQPH